MRTQQSPRCTAHRIGEGRMRGGGKEEGVAAYDDTHDMT
jgi:hypothetical protein